MTSVLANRIAKLEAATGASRMPARIVMHVLDCPPAERPDRLAAIKAADPEAFHIVRVVVRPGEVRAAA